MGLAGPKNQVKLSHDPNNTKWTNDTQGFGHKIMTSQGWTPGQYLGAKDAKHAEFHTAANASHIRVSIKDDNLGLGAKIGSGVGHGECTGLDAFKNLLGRLNGKDEDEIEKEQKSRDDLKRAIYTERRWGSIRFVQGGFLIGDKIQHLIDGEAERIRKLALGENAESSDSSDSSDSSSESEEEAPAPVEKAKKSKKRKLEDVEKSEIEVVAVKVKKSKKHRKSEANPEDEAEVAAAMKAAEKAAKKQAKKDRKAKESAEDTTEDVDVKERKREKREKKDRKEKKEKKDKSASNSDLETKESRKKKSKRDKDKDSTDSSRATTKESTPATPITIDTSGRAVPLMGGRHAVRARNIAQKRMASMDVASLNQIFMIKS